MSFDHSQFVAACLEYAQLDPLSFDRALEGVSLLPALSSELRDQPRDVVTAITNVCTLPDF